VSRPSFGELDGRDPYDILELPPGASDADVRAARKRLLRRYHPDLPSGDLRRTQLITAAADLLLDPPRRIGYYDLRDEESRRWVFAAADVADDGYQAARPTYGGGASAGPARPIRPTFVTPPGHPSPPAGPFRRTSPEWAPGAGAPAATSRWNALAVASVVAILTWTPIPLILGLLALRQIHRYGQRGTRLALTGVIVGAIFVLIYVYVLVFAGF
jgi:hypothetical protein